MRVTNHITTNTYLKNSRRIDSSMLKSMTRVMTQRRFNRVSEDVINGTKALSLRRQLRNVKIYRDNLNASSELFSSAEQALLTMSGKVYPKMETELVAASNGSYDQLELDIFSLSFEQMAEEMVKTLNADFAERQLFGGTNNGVAPFSIEQAIVTIPTDTQVTNEDGELVFTNADGEQVSFSEDDWAALPDDEKAEYTAVMKQEVVYPPDWETYYQKDEATGGVAVDENGELLLQDGITMDDIPKSVLYNGVPINFDVLTNRDIGAGTYTVSKLGLDESGQKAFTTSEFELSEETIKTARNKHDNSLIFPGSKPIYVDIGIGIKYDSKQTVDPQTALDVSLNGAAITGCGMDEEGFSKNIIQLALDTAYHLKRGTNVATEMNLDKANTTIADLAAKTAGGQELSDAEFQMIAKDLAAAKIGATISRNDNGDYIVKVGGMEVFNSSVDYNGNLPTIDVGESTDSAYVILQCGDKSIKLNKCIGDQSYVNAVIDRAADANSNVLKQITTLGIKQNTIDFYMDRMTDTEFNLKDRQNLVEGTDMEEEITNEYNLQAAYEAALKMGSWALPKSIFDFI